MTSPSETTPRPSDTGARTSAPRAVDWNVVQRWLSGQGLGGSPITDIEPIGGGTQNLMYRFRVGDTPYVLRRGPAHPRGRTNEVLRREARLLAALGDTLVPVPRLIAAEPDESVLGSVFYLMEPVLGFNATVELPASHTTSARLRRQMGLEVIDALSALGTIDPNAVGLSDFGRPDGFLDRQVPRWLAELDGYGELDGYAGGQLPGIEHIATWLTGRRPAAFRPGIMHGDFHVANLMFDFDSARVAAIVDWEMCTIGDPLLDLGWLLTTWPEPGSVTEHHHPLGRAGGLVRRTDLVEHYAAVADRPIDDVLWYTVLASFKLAIVLEGTHARAVAGKAPKATGDFLHSVAVGLLDQAGEFIEKGL
ncbi:phosphotransferase family protein [Nocardia inohanensis]|uniref:phosphotransferase family protein n=1 Tax=Nocardia inohanensis TaxID=209246 RepID=UPI0009FE78E6|nr:phosphotransferase family protein [Nocardia inohanensis]